MQQDDQERPSSDAFVHLIDLVETAEPILQESRPRRKDDANAHQHRGRQRSGLGHVLVGVGKPVMIIPFAGKPEYQRDTDSQHHELAIEARFGSCQHGGIRYTNPAVLSRVCSA